MEDLDNSSAKENRNFDEEEMFLNEVIRGEHDLLFLDTYLKESFGSM